MESRYLDNWCWTCAAHKLTKNHGFNTQIYPHQNQNIMYYALEITSGGRNRGSLSLWYWALYAWFNIWQPMWMGQYDTFQAMQEVEPTSRQSCSGSPIRWATFVLNMDHLSIFFPLSIYLAHLWGNLDGHCWSSGKRNMLRGPPDGQLNFTFNIGSSWMGWMHMGVHLGLSKPPAQDIVIRTFQVNLGM